MGLNDVERLVSSNFIPFGNAMAEHNVVCAIW